MQGHLNQSQAERTIVSLQRAEVSSSSNSGSSQGTASGSNTFSSQSALARDNVSTFSPIEIRGESTSELGRNLAVELALDGSNTEALESSGSRHELAGNIHHGPKNLENSSPSSRWKQNLDNLRSSQGEIPSNPKGSRRLPIQADFSPSISLEISRDELHEPDHIIIYLHQHGENEASLKGLAQELQDKLPRSAYILVRGVKPVTARNNSYHRADPQSQWGEEFLNASCSLLIDVINDALISKCNFMPSNIMVLGHCQGGMAALATVASCDWIEFGGVISIGGPLPSSVQLDSTVKAKTPALILRAALGDVNPSALQRIKDTFVTVDVETREGAHDTIPKPDALRPILDFFGHRFHRAEWEKQAIVSFDGGGMKGLGSLLILRELMNKVGDEEKRNDREDGCAESSFSPRLYKPNRIHTDSSQDEIPTGTDIAGLPNSSLYLPCHYFTYAAGTSTGGLISIMLSRFRMTVEDCITEYKSLGERIFGHPRPIGKYAILWHKFSAQALEQVIQEVTSRHCEARDLEATFPSDEDLCRTLVYAYADHFKSDVPFAFRTYCLPRPRHRKLMKNYGEAPNLPIWQVARATSAAPGYFHPIAIKRGDGSKIRFKDGGFGTNNPTREAYWDIKEKHGAESKIGLVISIGTGQKPLDLFARNPGRVKDAIATFKAAFKLPSMTLNAHREMLNIVDKDGEIKIPYYRFEGGGSLGELAMDEWKSHHFTRFTGHSDQLGIKTIEKIEVGTAAYLQSREVQDKLVACAKLLVRRRRLRTRDVSMWDRYASASYYECDREGCQAKQIKTRHEYEEHMKNQHDINEVTDSVLEQRRRCWTYRNRPTESNLHLHTNYPPGTIDDQVTSEASLL